jgi:hypothetical protein
VNKESGGCKIKNLRSFSNNEEMTYDIDENIEELN